MIYCTREPQLVSRTAVFVFSCNALPQEMADAHTQATFLSNCFISPLKWQIIYQKLENDTSFRAKMEPLWFPFVWRCQLQTTGGHFACACVNPLNDNSVGASNLMAGNRKLARKVTVLLKAISLVLWIPHFPSKNILHHKNQTFSTRVFTCRFFSSRFPWPFKDFQDSTPKSHVLYKSDFHWQSNAFLWFDFQTRGFTYQGGNAS